jgi:hypothetical protein
MAFKIHPGATRALVRPRLGLKSELCQRRQETDKVLWPWFMTDESIRLGIGSHPPYSVDLRVS